MTKSIKKYNAEKITEILNSRMAAGIGYSTEYRGHFEVNGTWILCTDIDRGSRQDHGGGNGDEWMSDGQLDAQNKRWTKRYQKSLDMISDTIISKGYAKPIVYITVDEKGFVSIEIGPAKDAKIAKPKTEKKSTAKKMGVIETIRQALTTDYLSKKNILKVLVASFPDREADKMMKTISAQLPSRIVKGTNFTIARNYKKEYKIIPMTKNEILISKIK